MLRRIIAAGRLAQGAMLLGGLLVAVVAMRCLDDPAPTGEGEAAGRVVSVDTAQLEGRGSTSTFGIGLVELPDGRRTLLFLSRPWPAAGATIRLRYTEYADGSRTYVHEPLP